MRFIYVANKMYFWLAISLGMGLTALVIAACSTVSTVLHSDPLPQLLQVIELPDEDSTTQIAVQQGGFAYVLNETSESIAVIDGPELVTIIHMPGNDYTSFVRDIVAHPETGLVYVADVLQGIHVIRGTEIITTITDSSVERKFHVLAVHPNTGYVYAGGIVKDAETQEATGNIRVINGTQVLADIVDGKSVNSLTPDLRNERLYAGRNLIRQTSGTSLMSVIDGATRIMTTTLDYDLSNLDHNVYIHDVIMNPTTGELYLWENQSVVYLDGEKVQKRLQLGAEHGPPVGMGWDPKRDIIYVGLRESPYSLAIHKNRDPQELRIVAGSMAFVYDETRDYIYSADYNGPSMSVIRGTEVLTTIHTGGRGPKDVAVDEERGYIYVSNADSHSVSVFGFDETK